MSSNIKRIVVATGMFGAFLCRIAKRISDTILQKYKNLRLSKIYRISRGIINKDNNCFFGEAYDMSCSDYYDFSSKKQSLKKFEIELGITHKELAWEKWSKELPSQFLAKQDINDIGDEK